MVYKTKIIDQVNNCYNFKMISMSYYAYFNEVCILFELGIQIDIDVLIDIISLNKTENV